MIDQAANTMFGATTQADPAPSAPAATPQRRAPVPLAYTRAEIGDRQRAAVDAGRRDLLGENVPENFYDAEPAQDDTPEVRQPSTVPVITDPLKVPDAVARARTAAMTLEDTMYASTPVDLGGVADSVLRFDNPVAADAELEAYAAETGNVLTKDFLQSPDDAKQILNIAMQHRTAPPDARQIGEMRRQAWQQVQARYGRGAAQVVADAKAMIQRDPRVVQALNAYGLGDNPRVVMAACEAAVRARAQGKFPTARRR